MKLIINDRIRNRTVERFNQFKLDLKYDSMASSFAFDGYFNPNNFEQKELYCIGHYHKATMEHNGQKLLTGYLISESFSDGEKRELVRIGGFSLPGFLQDCQIPVSLYPLQSDGLTLRQIASKLIAPFDFKMIINSAVSGLMDEPYDKTTAGATQTIADYLTELAAQKGIVISHDINGNLLFTRAETNKKPVLDFDTTSANTIPFTSMTMTFDGQGMHSHIHVIKQASSKGGNAGESEIRNPYVPFVYRPLVVEQSSGTDDDTDKAAKMILASELKNLKLTIVTDRWQIDKNTIITPNNIITVLNPEVYLFKKSRWFVEEVSYEGNSVGLTATLTCCLPEVYSLEYPKYLFAGINLH